MKPEGKELGTGRVAFLALVKKEGIKEKVEAGRTGMSIYREHKHQLDISYSQFARYLKMFIKNPDEAKKKVEEVGKKKAVPAKKEKPQSKEGFVIDPKLNEDLY